jgi:hypothetical protein
MRKVFWIGAQERSVPPGFEDAITVTLGKKNCDDDSVGRLASRATDLESLITEIL